MRGRDVYAATLGRGYEGRGRGVRRILRAGLTGGARSDAHRPAMFESG